MFINASKKNSTKKYDFLVFIGRFQPFHNGHSYVIREALKETNKLILLIGSAKSPICYRNPFSYEDRCKIISLNLDETTREKVIFHPLNDFIYDDDAWVDAVYKGVNDLVADESKKIGLIGHNKDETTYYLDLFPRWGYLEVSNKSGISATPIRKSYFSDSNPNNYKNKNISKETTDFLQNYSYSKKYDITRLEFASVDSFRASISNINILLQSNVISIILICDNKILLQTRNEFPGKNLLQPISGDILADKTIKESSLKIIKNKLCIGVKKLIYKEENIVFDYPKRSSLIRTIVNCFIVEIKKDECFNLKLSEDMSWFNISEIKEKMVYEDYFFIIKKLQKEGRLCTEC